MRLSESHAARLRLSVTGGDRRAASDSDSGLGTAASLLHSRSKEAARPDVPPLGRGSDTVTAARRQRGPCCRLSERPVGVAANLRSLAPVCRGGSGWLCTVSLLGTVSGTVHWHQHGLGTPPETGPES